mmetsp:Transcript_27268/g.88061  ORF Transcript_27268/g.88061 Transcript_27268/m.88061 type:complete len:194 (-) Transcript_27268:1934-2515(-)
MSSKASGCSSSPLLATIAAENLDMDKIDAYKAFTQEFVDAEIYVEMPDGFVVAGHVLNWLRVFAHRTQHICASRRAHHRWGLRRRYPRRVPPVQSLINSRGGTTSSIPYGARSTRDAFDKMKPADEKERMDANEYLNAAIGVVAYLHKTRRLGITWKASKLKIVADSSAEAETAVASRAAKAVIAVRSARHPR